MPLSEPTKTILASKIAYHRICLNRSFIIRTFQPLILEHFGLWDDGALNYLTELSKKSLNLEGHLNAIEFKSYWRQRLGVTIQNCNSEVILRKLKRLSGKDDINHWNCLRNLNSLNCLTIVRWHQRNRTECKERNKRSVGAWPS